MVLNTGDTIRAKRPYEGEGEYIIAEPDKEYPGMIKAVHACCKKCPELNGQVRYLSADSLIYFEKCN